MSIWLCPACMTLTGPTNAPCPKCGSAVERAILATGPAPMPDDSTGPVQFQPFNPERADATFAEYARNDALSCKECRGSGMTKVMRYTSACLACKGTGRIPSAAAPGQTHYEGCERTAGHHRCAVAKLDAAQRALEDIGRSVEAAGIDYMNEAGDFLDLPTRVDLLVDERDHLNDLNADAVKALLADYARLAARAQP